MRMLFVTMTMLAASSILSAADKKIASHDGSCQVMAPAAWDVGSMGGSGTSTDKKAFVTVTSPKGLNFETLKQNARRSYPGDKVTKDSATEFEMEGKTTNGKPNVYRAVPLSGGKACLAKVIYESGTVDDARKIAESLKAAK